MSQERTALIADVVGSRDHADQSAMLRALAEVARRVTAEVAHVQAPGLTVGDEVQAVYADLATAVEAWLLMRALAGRTEPALDLRVGLGCGDIEVSGAAPPPAGQSGTAWWRAREALDEARALVSRSHWPRSIRTRVVTGDAREGAVNAVLTLADEILSGLDATDLAILLGLRAGRPQRETAAEVGLSQPAVARRQGDKGISALHRAIETFTTIEGEGRTW